MKRLLLTSALCCGMAYGAAIPTADENYTIPKSWFVSASDNVLPLAGAALVGAGVAFLSRNNVISKNTALAVGAGGAGITAYNLYQNHKDRQIKKEDVGAAFFVEISVLDIPFAFSVSVSDFAIEAAKIDSSKWPQFIETVNALSVGMDGWNKRWLSNSVVAKVDPSKWTPEFIKTVNALTVGMDGGKLGIIDAVAKVHSSKLTREFIQTVNALSVGTGGGYYKSRVIEVVAKVNSSNYARFIQTVNALSEGFNDEKMYVIEAVAHMKPEWYDLFVPYARQNNFFTFVQPSRFAATMQYSSEENILNTYEQFEAFLTRLRNVYAAEGARQVPRGVAFEIHKYAHAVVVTDTGTKQQLETAVVSKVNELNENTNKLDYDLNT